MNLFDNSKLATRAAAVLLVAGGIFGTTAQADDLNCKLSFSLKGWSAFYKTASGHGVVTCSDGTSMKVHLHAEGGGVSFGKTTIDDGHGDFSGVKNIREVLGDYAAGSAHAAAVDAGTTIGLTKGEISLGLTGTGRGWDIGVDFSGFTISEVLPKVLPPPPPPPPQ